MDLKSTHGLGDLYFAVLEGVLFNVYHCSLALHKTLLRLSRLLYRAELPEVRIF